MKSRRKPVGLAAGVLISGLIATACVPTVYSDVRLEEVRRPEDVSQRWGEYTIEEAQEEGIAYEDELVRVLTVPGNGLFLFNIENKTEHTIQLVWDQMSFVGPEGTASPMSSGKTRIIDVGESRPPTPIPANSTVEVSAIPNNLVSGTTVGSLFPASDSARFDELEGKTMRVLVPLKVQDTVNEYSFVFRINELRIGEGG